MRDAQQTYLIGQACPWWAPEPDEISDYSLHVLASVHQVYEQHRLVQEAKMLAQLLGGSGE